MKLTRKKAIELCIEVWTWCTESGALKCDYPYSKKQLRYVVRNDYPESHCWFCEYCLQHKDNGCKGCPLGGENKCEDMAYEKWDKAKTPRTRKKYAKLFLAQIKELK